MLFSDHLWEKNLPIYEAILNQAFNQELKEGTLAKERFAFYIEQDALYLLEFSKAFASIASRLEKPRHIEQYLNFAHGALIAERGLHLQFLPDEFSSLSTSPSPACLGYTSFLRMEASLAPIEEAMAAMLPCFWIYREVGRYIAADTKKDNPYALWIDTYSSAQFSNSVNAAISILDELASDATSKTLAAMEKAYKRCALFEWHFWNDSYDMRLLSDLTEMRMV